MVLWNPKKKSHKQSLSLPILSLINDSETIYGRWTYDVHENCLILKTPHPAVHLRSKFFHPPGPWTSNLKWTPPPPTPSTPTSLFDKLPIGIYLLKVNNRNTRTRCEICWKLTIKTLEPCHWSRLLIFNM